MITAFLIISPNNFVIFFFYFQRGTNLSSSGSLWSLHSGATAFVQNNIDITGCVYLTLNYDNKINTLLVHIAHCRNVAPADSKKKNSNP